MRTIRVVVVGVLMVGGLAVLAPGATAATPQASKACQTLNSLNQKLEKALGSAKTGKVDTGAVSSVSSSFKKPPKGTPSSVKSAMNTIAGVASSVGHSGSTAAALGVIRNAGAKLTAAAVTWGAYLAKTCPPA
jgi:hypothetical protein